MAGALQAGERRILARPFFLFLGGGGENDRWGGENERLFSDQIYELFPELHLG